MHRFVAEVLPQNRRMLGVFRDAGYEVRHDFEDGVVSLSFDIDPTERSLAVMESREHRAEFRSVAALLAPRSVVLVGASRRPGTVGHRLLRDLLAGGLRRAGCTWCIPRPTPCSGCPPSARSPTCPATPAPRSTSRSSPSPRTPSSTWSTSARAAGVRGLVVVSGGFAETGAEGLERQRALVRFARANGMRVVGPNSWGLVNTDPAVRLNVGLLPALPVAGRVGLFCQSGAMSASRARDRGAARRWGSRPSCPPATGPTSRATTACSTGRRTSGPAVVGLYLESMGNPRKFSRIARRLAASKPVVVVRPGTSAFGVPPGAGGAAGAGRRRRRSTRCCARAGASGWARCTSSWTSPRCSRPSRCPAGPRVGVVANSEALGALVADAAVGSGLDRSRRTLQRPDHGGAGRVRPRARGRRGRRGRRRRRRRLRPAGGHPRGGCRPGRRGRRPRGPAGRCSHACSAWRPRARTASRPTPPPRRRSGRSPR